MGLFKWLLGKKEEQPVEVAVEPVIVQPEPLEQESRGKCNYCQKEVYLEDKYSKQLGQYYHRKCWKEVVKSTWGK